MASFKLSILALAVVSLLSPSTVHGGLLSSVVSSATSAVSTAVSTATTAAETVANTTSTVVSTATSTVANATSTAVETVSNATTAVTTAVSDAVSTVTSALTSASEYYTIGYAWKIYSGCLRSCLMYINNETARDECATTRSAYCTKMKAYSMPTLITTYVTKLAAKAALSSIF